MRVREDRAAFMEALSGVGPQLRRLRKRRGLTQAGLAARIGRSVETLSALERGKNLPTLGVLQRTAAVLEVPLRDFFPLPAGAASESPAQTALVNELLETARALPPDDLELALRIVDLMTRREHKE